MSEELSQLQALQLRVTELETERQNRIKTWQENRPNGEWIDKWGACRVCSGEIPYGHTENCDHYKLEKEIRRWNEESRAARGLLSTNVECAEGEQASLALSCARAQHRIAELEKLLAARAERIVELESKIGSRLVT